MKPETLKHIVKEYGEQTVPTSKICRTIVFALIGAIWMFFQKDGIFSFTYASSLGLVLLGIYILIDVFQYFSGALMHGLMFFRKTKIKNPDSLINKADLFSFIMFLTKFLYLLVVIVVFAVYIFTVLYES